MNELFIKLKELQPEADYQTLMSVMQNYSHPRRKLKDLQKKELLTRVKKGFYVFNSEFFGKNYSKEITSNLLYGPSYISLEYALSHYGLIPERVENLTAITCQKNKKFETPIGVFTYRHLNLDLYQIGVIRAKNSEDGRYYLIASAEKALLDYYYFNFSKNDNPTKAELIISLEEDLRCSLKSVIKLISKKRIKELKSYYIHREWCSLLIDLLEERL